MTNETFRPTIRTQADLQDAWQHLMGAGGFDGRSLWLMLIVGDRPLPHLTEITDLAEDPEEEDVERFAEFLAMLVGEVEPEARIALLCARPGHDLVTAGDRAWATTLYAAIRRSRVPGEVVHLATQGAIRPLPPDELSWGRRTA